MQTPRVAAVDTRIGTKSVRNSLTVTTRAMGAGTVAGLIEPRITASTSSGVIAARAITTEPGGNADSAGGTAGRDENYSLRASAALCASAVNISLPQRRREPQRYAEGHS